MRFTRKPGEPIYSRSHMVVLLLAVCSAVLFPYLYELVMGPLSFGARLLAGVMIAIVAGIAIHFLYRSSARNEP